jgi:hypothetical protein
MVQGDPAPMQVEEHPPPAIKHLYKRSVKFMGEEPHEGGGTQACTSLKMVWLFAVQVPPKDALQNQKKPGILGLLQPLKEKEVAPSFIQHIPCAT